MASSSCIATDKCFPFEPCLDSSDCNGNRWECNTGRLAFNQDENNSFGQCESGFVNGSVFFFTANVVLFALFVIMICLSRAIPIIFCFKHWPCLRKKNARGRGGKPKTAAIKKKASKHEVDKQRMSHGGVVDVANVRHSYATSKALEMSPPAPLPNLEEVYEHSRLSSQLVSHDVDDGDGVVLQTIHSRALTEERAEAARIYRTAALMGMLLDLDAISLKKLEPAIASGFAEAYRLISEGMKAATVPSRGKHCLDRATLLFEEIIKTVVQECFPWYEGAENWDLEGKEHKTLDIYVAKCVEIVNTDPPSRTCFEFCRRRPAKPMPEFPEMPMFGASATSALTVKVHLDSVPEVGAAPVDPNGTADKQEKTVKFDVSTTPSKPRRKTRDGSKVGGSGVFDEEADPDSKKRGLVGMASEICMRSARSFDTGLLSSRKFTLANSSMNLGGSKAELGVSSRLASSAQNGDVPKSPLLSRMQRAVSNMQTERAMTSILASSPKAKMPELDKIFTHAELCADMHHGVHLMNLNYKQNEAERAEAIRIYRIASLFCKLLDLDPSAMSSEISDKIGSGLAEAQALMTEGLKTATLPSKSLDAFNRASKLFTEIVDILTAVNAPFHGFTGASQWTTECVEFLALDEYVHDCVLLFEDEPPRSCLQRIWHKTPLFWRRIWQAFGIPDSMRTHPFFYFVYLFAWGMFVIRFFAVTCDVGKEAFNNGFSNISVEELGTVPAFVCLQTPGRTYLGVGAQYKAILGKGTNADFLVPLMFGVMHSLLFVFGTIPVPMARGFWRDVSYWLPFMRKVIPIDDHIFFHKFLGYLALLNLFIGAGIWVGIMGYQECFSGNNSKITCTAWDPLVIKTSWFNLFENVVMLRVVVIFTWFFGITWMRYQNEPPKYWFFGLLCFKRLPNFFRQHWFEFAYILHVTIALATFILAEAARFEVFYPVLATWLLYVADSIRETLFMTFRCDIEVAHSTVHLDPQDHNRPTTMTVQFENPWRPKWRGGCIKRRPSQGAGMWVFVKIPAISKIEWHPFSLASADGDDFVQLQIGIRAGVSTGWRKPDNWVLDESSDLAKVTGEGSWVQKECKTWTYKLYELLLNTSGNTKIPCKIRGPYGSSFRLCFNHSVKGALIMGAGTGLSAVESMLRAMLHRKERAKFTPNHVWVCWQARRVGDLLWLWDSLNSLLIKALDEGNIKKPLAWTPASKTLGFLRVTFFISRAESNQLDTLRNLPKSKNDKHNVHEWLTSRNRIIQSSISSEATHISKYIRHVRAELNRLEDSRHAKLGISFCGPSAVSKLIADAAAEVGGHIEFSSDATA